MKKIHKKIKKMHRKMEKKTQKFLRQDPNLRGLTDIIYVLIIVFALTYGGLIYVACRNIDRGNSSVVVLAPPTEFQKRIESTIDGYPMEKMMPYLAQEDKKVATFLLAIAKKESNWGRYSPKKNGRECWNYWGFRGNYNVTESGYSCFDSPKQAVEEVGGRVQELIDKDIDTPREMAVWKCGYDCSWDNPTAVNKWVSDVGFYYKKLYN